MINNKKKRPFSVSKYNNVKEEIREIKVILLGETGVGKTNIIGRYLTGNFDSLSNPTLGSTFGEKIIKREGCTYSLKVWDTTGQEKYNSITKLFIKGAQIVILVYSIDNISSFQKINFWHNYINEELSKKKYILGILGNKKDLFESEVVSEEDGKRMAKEKDAIFGLVSAKVDKKGIEKYFEMLLDEFIIRFGGENLSESSFSLEENSNSQKKCC